MAHVQLFGQEIPEKRAPEWVHLLPLGEVKARDGREFIADAPQEIIAWFQNRQVDLPIDYHHQSERDGAARQGPLPVAGWITELAEQPDGIWAKVRWTDRARGMIEAGEYRYISPTLLYHATSRRVFGIKSAGLVHDPALHLTALANEETQMDKASDLMSRLIAALDLPDDTPEDDILTALQERLAAPAKPDPRKYVPIGMVEELIREVRNGKSQATEERAKQKVEAAFSQGYLTTPMRDWAMDLCRVDEQAFDTFIASAAPPYAHLTRVSHMSDAPPERKRVDHARDVEAVARQLGIDPAALDGD